MTYHDSTWGSNKVDTTARHTMYGWHFCSHGQCTSTICWTQYTYLPCRTYDQCSTITDCWANGTTLRIRPKLSAGAPKRDFAQGATGTLHARKGLLLADMNLLGTAGVCVWKLDFRRSLLGGQTSRTAAFTWSPNSLQPLQSAGDGNTWPVCIRCKNYCNRALKI